MQCIPRRTSTFFLVCSALGFVAPVVGLAAPAANHLTRPIFNYYQAIAAYGPEAEPSWEQKMALVYNEDAHRAYNALFPYYAQICTGTQYVKRATDTAPEARGGTGGHATLFLHGACIDRSAVYPRLKMCEPGDALEVGGKLGDPDSGLGISANQVFANVNWAAIPRRSHFFHAGLGQHEDLDHARYAEALRSYVTQPFFKGIALRPKETARCKCKNLGFEDCSEDGIAKLTASAKKVVEERVLSEQEQNACLLADSLGTDFGLSMARTLFCARIPMPAHAMRGIVADLNARNDEAHDLAAKTGRGYVWDKVTNNCSHLIANAFAAAGIFPPKFSGEPALATYVRIFFSYLNPKTWLDIELGALSIPVHNFVRIANAGFALPLDDVKTLYKDRLVQGMLNGKEPWLSTQAGSLIEVLPVRPGKAQAMGNAVYDEGKEGMSISKRIKERFHELSAPKYANANPDIPQYAAHADLCANLAYFSSAYADAAEQVEATLPDTSVENDAFTLFAVRYGDFLEHKSEEYRTDLQFVSQRFSGCR